VLLRGINRSGLEYADPGEHGFLRSAGISESEIDYIVRVWGANVLRIPFNQGWALEGRAGFPAAAYLEGIDRIVFWAARAGAYTLLDLHWLDADIPRGRNADGSCNRVPALPNAASIDVWRILAERYKSEPAVLFDIFNEPHHPLPGDDMPERRVTMAEWQPWARRLVHAIRDSHPRALVFVPGVSWAYDLRGLPLTVSDDSSDVFQDVVYSTHVYPWCGRALGRRRFGWRRDRLPAWREAFGSLARSAPVFIGEWGGAFEDLRWGEWLARYARWLGIGWTAWSWSDRPRLVVDAQAGRYEETPFGRLVRRHLRSTARV
jgi:hypothetical protein